MKRLLLSKETLRRLGEDSRAVQGAMALGAGLPASMEPAAACTTVLTKPTSSRITCND